VVHDAAGAATLLPLARPLAAGVRVRLPSSAQTMILPGIVRWTTHDGMGIQFGALGARETYAVMAIARGDP
jgi:hypothetical protein